MATATMAGKAKSTNVFGLTITREEADQLQEKGAISLENRTLGEMGTFLREVDKKLLANGKSITWGEFLSYSRSGGCPGIKLKSYDENCGLYWRVRGLEVCCEE